MNVIHQTADFARWLRGLADSKGKARIVARIEAARTGNWGDYKPIGDGLIELRVDVGPGYRVYVLREGKRVYLLLCGGDKSTQRADIRKALGLARSVRNNGKEDV